MGKGRPAASCREHRGYTRAERVSPTCEMEALMVAGLEANGLRGSGRLDGKVAIITGAARGQGAAEAKLFVAEGASVVLTDVLDTDLKAVAVELGSSALALPYDVGNEDTWAACVQAATETFGGVDVL